jgi:gas vesicle protein
MLVSDYFTHGGSIMTTHNDDDSGLALALAFLGGAMMGIMTGFLLAPRSGEETRRELKGYARRTEEEVLEKAKEARAALDELIGHGKQFVEDRRADVEAALQAGKEAMREKRDR